MGGALVVKGVLIASVFVFVAAGVSRARSLHIEKDLFVAAVRALVQLAAVASVIAFVFERLGLSALFIAVMLVAAAWTSGRRMKGIPRAPWLAAAVIALASGIPLAVLFGAGAFPMEPQYLIPIAGMLIGNNMTAASVAGSRLRDELVDKRLEVEARLALGVRATTALEGYSARATVLSLIPIVDSTKNVGLILLPGAFVGMILGGETPAEAAKVQLIVLFMLLGAVAIASMVTSLLVARAFIGPGERVVIPQALQP